MTSRSESVELLPEHTERTPLTEDQGWSRNYKKLEQIGSGGWAVVFKAVDAGGRQVALKLSKTEHEQLRRFEREVEALTKINHPNVVAILESGPGWYVMPLAEGNLTELAPELSDEERVEAIAHIAAGLAAAHAASFTHRDVTPNNMLRMKDGERSFWALSDFGMVRRPPGMSSMPATKGRLGTQGFMAPEVPLLGAHKATPLADIYGLGRTIEFITTAKWPVHQEAIVAPAVWEPLVSKMTCHPLEDRFQSMEDVLAALPVVRARIKDERRANFVEATTEPSAPLRPQELAVLNAIVALTSETFTEQDLRNETRKTASRATITVGLLGLRDRGFLDESRNDDGYRIGEQLSPLGTQWVLSHHDKFHQQLEPEAEPQGPAPFPNDDAPF